MNVRELFDLTHRTALVTGGAGIYGSPISEALAEAGAHVIVASRNHAQCETRAEALRQKGMQASADHYDQASETSILQLRDRILQSFGSLDILVNNSVGRSMRRYQDPLETWRQSMEVNATGLFAISRAFLDPMMEKGRGTIINIGSIQGVVAPDFRNFEGTEMTTPPDYHFHKHGLIGMTKYLAAWAGSRGIRVNAISPGGFQTEGLQEPFLSRYRSRVLLKRMAEHDDIKGVVVFLASDASRYITGQNIVMDGGYSC
ncbi:MAG: SDR family oxidoreductase [Acidobacteriota bacterium]|nr:SDR family oxidoreductase [Acidobacteriota bacterium]